MDERLSWPSWLTYSGRFTHISGHPSTAGRAQDRESSPVRDRRSTTVPHHQFSSYESGLARLYHFDLGSNLVLSAGLDAIRDVKKSLTN